MGETGGGWPFLPAQCPQCRYFYAYESERTDDKGYALPGFCRHPRIAMELFIAAARSDFSEGSCPLFVRDLRRQTKR